MINSLIIGLLVKILEVYMDKQSIKKGFTLAEVLITLGIIGIVAAITIPNMMSNYRKKLKSTRLKHFYSTLTQSVRMNQGGDSDLDASMLTQAANPDVMMDFVNANYTPYIKFTVLKKSQYGVIAGFPDGSGAEFVKTGGPLQSTANTYIIFCPEYKDCDPSQINSIYGQLANGTTRFYFWTRSVPSFEATDNPRDFLLSKCIANDFHLCTRLLYLDKWEFKHDYPHKL